MKTLASYGLKGGVGKTASAVNLAYLAAEEGARTLLCDLDPQGAATFYFRVRARVKGGGGSLLQKKRALQSLIKGTDYPGLDLLPADFSYRRLDSLLGESKRPGARLRKRLRTLRGDYDYVFLDCPPGLTLTAETVFEAADGLLVPTIPTVLSLRALDQLEDFLAARRGGPPAELLVFFSLIDRRKRLHAQLVDTLPAQRDDLLRAGIPNSSDVERMGTERRPVPAFAPDSPAALAYRALWAEVKRRLG